VESGSFAVRLWPGPTLLERELTLEFGGTVTLALLKKLRPMTRLAEAPV
jgi:hypothetical protein